MTNIIETAYQLLKTGDSKSIESGLAKIRPEAESRPTDMKAQFDYAGAFDFVGQEADAFPHYERVYQAGYETLPEDDQPRLFVQLGSTLRNLNQLQKSRDILLEGINHFPEVQTRKAFLALTEHSAGNHTRAIQYLFDVVLKNRADSSISNYGRALRSYAEEL